MIEQILNILAEGGDPSMVPEIDSALEDPVFRESLITTAVERHALAGQIPEEALLAMKGSAEGARQFLAGLSMFLGMEASMEAGLTPSQAPVATVIDPRPAPESSVDRSELEAAVALFSNCFYLGHCFGDSVSIEADGFVLPNYTLATVQVAWNSATGPHGELPLAAEQRAPFGDGRLDRDGQLSFDLSFAAPIEDRVVMRASGRGTVTLPVRVATLSFGADELDVPRSAGAITATLTSCTNDCVRVLVEGLDPEQACTVIARDAAGLRLAERESQTRTRESFESNLRFAGTVASVEFHFVAETAKLGFEATATKAPGSSSDAPVPIEAPRFLPPRRSAAFVKMSSEEFLNAFEIVPGRDYASMEFNQPAVHAHLPRVDNSAFAELDWDEVRPLDDTGHEIPHQLAQRGYNEDMHCFSVSFESDEYGGEPIELARATGRVRIQFPLEVQTVTVMPRSPEAGSIRAEFDGAIVTLALVSDPDPESPVDLSWISWRAGRSVSTVEAFDAEGRRLRPLDWSSSHGNALRLPFWGEVASLRVSLPAKWEKLERSFDVGPAPKLPEELQGMSSNCRG